jgi:hypothetical protein
MGPAPPGRRDGAARNVSESMFFAPSTLKRNAAPGATPEPVSQWRIRQTRESSKGVHAFVIVQDDSKKHPIDFYR